MGETMINLDHLEELAAKGPLVLRQEEARRLIAEVRRLRTVAASYEELERIERDRACALALVALGRDERCPRCGARAGAHRNHPQFAEVARG